MASGARMTAGRAASLQQPGGDGERRVQADRRSAEVFARAAVPTMQSGHELCSRNRKMWSYVRGACGAFMTNAIH
jgi:hypothetical protein